MLGQLTQFSEQHNVCHFWLAVAHAGMGETAAALDALDNAYQQHDVMLVWLGVDPRLDPVRGEPRYFDLLRRIGLAPRAGSARSGG